MDRKNDVPERWSDDLAVVCDDPSLRKQLYDALRNTPFPGLESVTPLEPTPEEKIIIRKCIDAALAFTALLKMPERPFSEERIILVSERQYLRRVAKTPGGKTVFGRMYVCRVDDPIDLITIVTHEMGHCLGYFVPEVTAEVDHAGTMRVRYSFRKSGYLEACGKDCKGYGLFLPHYHGLNEAVTETIGLYLRELYAEDMSAPFGQDVRLLHVAAYPAAILLLRELVERVANGGNAAQVWARIIKDHVDGTRHFLDDVDAVLPGADRVLRRTGATTPEVIASATELGLTRVLAKLHRIPSDAA